MKDGYFLGTIILITYRRHSYSSGTHHILCFNHHRCLPWLVILLPACLSREPRLHRYPYCYPYPPVVSRVTRRMVSEIRWKYDRRESTSWVLLTDRSSDSRLDASVSM